MKKLAILLVLLAAMAIAGTALAHVWTTTGAIAVIDPPSSVEKGALESDTNIHLFHESGDCLESGSLAVDITEPGTYVGNAATLTPGTVDAGTCITSYLLHMDLESGGEYLSGSVTFSQPILGLIVLNNQLDASDFLGATGTYYAKAADGEIGRRVELIASSPGRDEVGLSADRHTLSVNLWVDPTWTDQIRIILPAWIAPEIDIKPGSYPNAVNINGNGVVPVAILGNEYFDVTEIDPATLEFGGLSIRTKGNGAPQCSVKDVSGDFSVSMEGAPDGYLDLVCQFVDADGFMAEGDGQANVFGYLYDGTPVSGWDSIKLVNQ